VRIGDTVVTTATVREVNGRAVIMDCVCTVDGKVAAEATITCQLVPRPSKKTHTELHATQVAH